MLLLYANQPIAPFVFPLHLPGERVHRVHLRRRATQPNQHVGQDAVDQRLRLPVQLGAHRRDLKQRPAHGRGPQAGAFKRRNRAVSYRAHRADDVEEHAVLAAAVRAPVVVFINHFIHQRRSHRTRKVHEVQPQIRLASPGCPVRQVRGDELVRDAGGVVALHADVARERPERRGRRVGPRVRLRAQLVFPPDPIGEHQARLRVTPVLHVRSPERTRDDAEERGAAPGVHLGSLPPRPSHGDAGGESHFAVGSFTDEAAILRRDRAGHREL